MRFDPDTGNIEFSPGLYLHRGMTRADILGMKAKWEDWAVIDGVPRALRSLINLPNKGISSKTILIVYIGLEERPLAFWELAPWDIMDGSQARPEGRYTKRMRIWFHEMFGVKLPIGGDWGHIDASYDHWNQSTTIVCNYRERFNKEEDWCEYRSNNKF